MTFSLRAIQSIALLLSFVGCAGDKSARNISFAAPKMGQISRPVTENQGIKVGDTIELFIMEDSSFNGVYKVREKGDIIIPKVGRIVIANLSVESAQARIKQTLESSQLTSATVIADRISSAAAPAVSVTRKNMRQLLPLLGRGRPVKESRPVGLPVETTMLGVVAPKKSARLPAL